MTMLKNRIALVTGAGHPQGIGWATAIELAQNGASVVVTDISDNADGLDALCEEIGHLGQSSMARVLDVTDPENASDVVSAIVGQFGQLDILVNNAGVGIGSPEFLKNPIGIWDATFKVNVYGVINCCKAVLPQMLEQRAGAIVNVASLSGLRHIPSIPPPYTASKFAVIGLTKSIAEEFGSMGIRCNAVCPGSVATQMRDKAMELLGDAEGVSREEAEAEENAMIALGRAAEPSEIASAVAYLASPSSAYLTGVALPVDGGWTLGL
jgi:NAD(P)-dependent dehydrogenase (short-subunit alcohol dehydrogenase family)